MVFVGITGAAFSGKKTLANLFVEKYNYTLLKLDVKAGKEEPLPAHDIDTILSHELLHTLESQRPRALHNHFSSAKQLISYVLSNYSQNFVTVIPDGEFSSIIEFYEERPCFLGIAIDCPLNIRYQSFLRRGQLNGVEETRCDDVDFSRAFLDREQGRTFGYLFQRCTVTMLNDRHVSDSEKLSAVFDSKLSSIIHELPLLVRPSWDSYFLKLCRLAATRSNCMKRKIGCVLVSAGTHRIIATGYNGTPIGLVNCNEGGCIRCNSNCGTGMDLAACLCIHAEENALLETGRERIAKNKGAGDPTILYCTTCPCLGCTKKIIQCGIAGVIYADNYHMDHESLKLFRAAGIPCKQFTSPLCLNSRLYL